MTRPQAFAFIALFLIGCILIPVLLSFNGHPDASAVVFAIAFLLFCYLPPDKILPHEKEKGR